MSCLLRRLSVVLVGLLTGVLSGCGGQSQPVLSPSAASALRGQLESVRSAAAAHDRHAALRALSQVSSQIRTDARAGELTAGEVARLETGIAQARRRILIEVVAPSAPATVTTTTTVAPTQPAARTPAPATPAGPKPPQPAKPAKPPPAAPAPAKP